MKRGRTLRGAFFFIVLAMCSFSALARPAQANPLAHATPVTEIPFNFDYEGWITVQIKINGEGPYDFIVDTGATRTAAFSNLADALQFTPTGQAPIRVFGLTTVKHLAPHFLGDLEIGGQVSPRHVGVIIPDWSDLDRTPHGVLGLDILARYIVYVDVAQKVIRLYDPATLTQGRHKFWSSTALIEDDFGEGGSSLFRIQLRMNRRNLNCVVDIGASGTLLNYEALSDLLAGVHFNGDRRNGFSTGSRIRGIFGDRKVARLARVPTVTIGKARWHKMTFLVLDAAIFKELNVHRKPFCFLGADVLATRSFILDFAHERLHIGPRPERKRPS